MVYVPRKFALKSKISRNFPPQIEKSHYAISRVRFFDQNNHLPFGKMSKTTTCQKKMNFWVEILNFSKVRGRGGGPLK